MPEWSLAGYDLVTWRSGSLEDSGQVLVLAASLVRVADMFGR